MSLERFISDAISPWMKKEGPESDIVLSSRVRLARNLQQYVFPIVADKTSAHEVISSISSFINTERDVAGAGHLEMLVMEQLKPIEKRVLVEKHLISPNLAEKAKYGAVLLNQDESISIMLNEEDHIRIQCLATGFQLKEVLHKANVIDDFIESHTDYAFDEKRGYLTSCPTNVGTGLRASVMMHLPALVLTKKISRIIPAINQLGLAVRGIYGEGTEAQGNIFQISNQMTLGKSEEDIIEDLAGVVMQVIQQERAARKQLQEGLKLQLEDKLYRSLGTLENSRIIQSKEAAKCLSDVRLGIDLEILPGISKTILNELMILTQPGFLQQYAGVVLTPEERDIRRATLIRERIKLENR
ncbi:protein arginine kinase [Fictibacillus phosphorivorans]|uniref:protein arginine kinase n=1 Tax=Fictibacillus phosphorivorans TaxID=1221500 RepID=UPI00203BC336|nr:protein arginine kinase [Fictibacillus phosphorivorans]MCM3719722.1 protein arginine kinase [Fictibacillus phosphorivorans]MCM3777480.1 protein arginine kinase [Fictibacillus phosphorivorans]